MARELYIYWRVREGALDAALAAVRQMQADLHRAHPGLQPRLLQREGEARTTLMEIYTCAPQGVSPTLQARIEAAALALQPHAAGPRHTEVFADPTG